MQKHTGARTVSQLIYQNKPGAALIVSYLASTPLLPLEKNSPGSLERRKAGGALGELGFFFSSFLFFYIGKEIFHGVKAKS